jgi:flagellar hook capping protein FlgD
MMKALMVASAVCLGALVSDASAQSFCRGNFVSNGDFVTGRVTGSMPSPGAVADWSALTATPQVVDDGCHEPGAIQMWGNLAVGESIQQQLPGTGFQAGRRYRITVCYRWLNVNPDLPQYVRFRLTASGSAPSAYPPTASYDVIGTTPNTSSTGWISYTLPDWTAPNNASWITVNPENDLAINDGNYVSWGQIDNICITELPCGIIDNGDFVTGRVPGSMPSPGAVTSWSVLTQTPQVIDEGCDDPGAMQMWGNLTVGESIKQLMPGPGFQAGKTYRVTVCYRWLNNNPDLPQYVRFRLTASSSAPAAYPPTSSTYDLIGTTPITSSTGWITYTLPDWTAPNNDSWIMVNPENNFTQNDGAYVSWGQIDNICIKEVPCAVVTNGDFTAGRVVGSMPSPGAVANWSVLTNSPQVVDEGCKTAGALQMWGNLAVGESVKQSLVGAGFQAGRKYRVTVCYRWLDVNPNLPQYVRFRLTASGSMPSAYPPTSTYDVIGTTPNTNSTSWISYTLPDWTAPSNESWITVNPENNLAINDGGYVSWGQIDDICVVELADVVGLDGPVAQLHGLQQNSPNPFGVLTTIRFDLARQDPVSLRIYDVAGRLVRTLLNGTRMEAGEHRASWDGRNDDGTQAQAGVYFYRLEAGLVSASKRMIFVR